VTLLEKAGDEERQKEEVGGELSDQESPPP
jgi:hypothetical protein